MIAGVQLYQILSPLVDHRFYPDVATEQDDSTPPYIVYQHISSQPENTLDGYTGHEWVHMQIDVYHNDKYKCALLANRVIEQINTNIKHSIYGGQTSTRDPDTGLYRAIIEYEFWQTTPTA